MIRVTTKDGHVHERRDADGVGTTTYEMLDKSRPTVLVLTKDGKELGSTYRWLLGDVQGIEVVGGPGPTDLLGVPITYVK